eukprot:30423-Hanusia_phi.AAC.1
MVVMMKKGKEKEVAGIVSLGILSIFLLVSTSLLRRLCVRICQVSNTTWRAERPYYLMMKPARTQVPYRSGRERGRDGEQEGRGRARGRERDRAGSGDGGAGGTGCEGTE